MAPAAPAGLRVPAPYRHRRIPTASTPPPKHQTRHSAGSVGWGYPEKPIPDVDRPSGVPSARHLPDAPA